MVKVTVIDQRASIAKINHFCVKYRKVIQTFLLGFVFCVKFG